MELKNFQRQVISDLRRYLELLQETRHSAEAFHTFLREKGCTVGYRGTPAYQDILPGAPTLCFKVPTGGGKTYIACHAVKPIFDAMPASKAKVVVWLVPSDAILEQTLRALRDPEHPYRRKLNTDFGSRVAIFDKQQLLNGENFSASTVTEQLSVMVLSYDSFRGRKESLKSRQENSNLVSFSAMGAPDHPLEDTDETSLLQAINRLTPLVIVDESHHARSKLSKEMLQNFNPCFVLDLTATPTKESNILCYVDPLQLKKENMVKLPVIVYNRDKVGAVIADAKDLRDRLEEIARQGGAGCYIRPIVLFQAQPRTNEGNATFEKIKKKLTEYGIPEREIAIKTAEINELKGTDLLSPQCEIRYIITVNALKEGWDCPFAYILASLANRSSRIEVEQIVGRILRQPYARRCEQSVLNMSYVLTCSNDFRETLQRIVSGLNQAGFSEKECREVVPSPVTPDEQGLLHLPEESGEGNTEAAEEGKDYGTEDVLGSDPTEASSGGRAATEMLGQAQEQGNGFESLLEEAESSGAAPMPDGAGVDDHTFAVRAEFVDEIRELLLPQFHLETPTGVFFQEPHRLLTKESLCEGFSLDKAAAELNWKSSEPLLAKIDLTMSGKQEGTPRFFYMKDEDQRFFYKYFSTLSSGDKRKRCKAVISNLLNVDNSISSRELSRYTDRILDSMSEGELEAVMRKSTDFARQLRELINKLKGEYAKKSFDELIAKGKITCRPSFALPRHIRIERMLEGYDGGLYEEEEQGNAFEESFVDRVSGLSNIRWWHRNLSGRGFVLNGVVNHYPDFILCTREGRIILVETKGSQLDNPDSALKLHQGQEWAKLAGMNYRYFMVYDKVSPDLQGAYTLDSEFLNILEAL